MPRRQDAERTYVENVDFRDLLGPLASREPRERKAKPGPREGRDRGVALV